MRAVISLECHTCTATVLVQKDAPLDLLLGTDLQSQLGFPFLQQKEDGTAVDLLRERKWVLTKVDDDHSALPFHSEDPEMDTYEQAFAWPGKQLFCYQRTTPFLTWINGAQDLVPKLELRRGRAEAGKTKGGRTQGKSHKQRPEQREHMLTMQRVQNITFCVNGI